jgi:hypothetical protein
VITLATAGTMHTAKEVIKACLESEVTYDPNDPCCDHSQQCELSKAYKIDEGFPKLEGSLMRRILSLLQGNLPAKGQQYQARQKMTKLCNQTLYSQRRI